MVDVDQFKSINDTYGHDAGDEVLIAVAQRFTQCLRPEDTVARLGGDEFAVVAEINPATALSAEQLVKRLEAHLHEPILYAGAPRQVGVTIGAASPSPATASARRSRAPMARCTTASHVSQLPDR